MCATRAKGLNLPLMSVYVLMGRDVIAIDNGYEVVADRQLATTFRAEVDMRRLVIDYDDTLVMGERVNLAAVQLVYQCRNKGIPVRLVTRHEGDLLADMRAHAISPELFDEVVHLTPGESKVPYVSVEADSVLVDNAFAERAEVHAAMDAPVFDVSEIPVLLDRGDIASLGRQSAAG